MSGRLASFRGPSTPTSSPVQSRVPSNPSSPSKHLETTYHRKVRTTLQELRSVAKTWDDLVTVDGLKAIKSLVDTRTELENALHIMPLGELPKTHMVGPALVIMEKRLMELDIVVQKLRKQFSKMNALIEGLEESFYEAHKTKGWAWVHSEPLWCTWSFETFVSKLPELLPPYHRSISMHINQVEVIRKQYLNFEASRDIVTLWVAQPHLEEAGWDIEWEDICTAEVERWHGR
ncbi:hypothetical protein BD410DRAFT_714239 [Rickenella mellea]|uniref:Uncharacterized protein n=1 Tax=Rickenella mellea TaxID=50990 RepID=A0A4Y7QI08_9AGAM|nr:hypothetical protein BD410DRAFT_714239 [Rickenella mellea]